MAAGGKMLAGSRLMGSGIGRLGHGTPRWSSLGSPIMKGDLPLFHPMASCMFHPRLMAPPWRGFQDQGTH